MGGGEKGDRADERGLPCPDEAGGRSQAIPFGEGSRQVPQNAGPRIEPQQSPARERIYLAIIAGFGMGESDTYRLVRESEVRHINYHGEYVELYELAGGVPLPREKAEKLGLKFLKKKKATKP